MTSATVALTYSKEVKAALLRDELPRGNMHEQKRREAIRWLGKRWVCHPVNSVAKREEPLPEVFTWKPRVLRGRRA